MIKTFKTFFLFSTRLCAWYNLVFFALYLFSCKEKDQAGIRLIWQNNKAIAVSIPENLVGKLNADSLANQFKVSLSNSFDSGAVLGDVKRNRSILFEPLIPFSRGLHYSIFFRDKKIGEFSIPASSAEIKPRLVNSYPTLDTVPENLLKIYLAFSAPMSEGQSASHITFIKDERDTLHDVFLDLLPELWNEDRTVLTLWLDPGRIKRDLQPNVRLGIPLEIGGRYRLIVSPLWKDAQGLTLQKEFTRNFIVVGRDSMCPDPNQWDLKLPAKNSRDPLVISIPDVLDYFLLRECLHIKDREGTIVKGLLEVYNYEKNCRFVPENAWKPGSYSLLVESRLEDLAGNNLNRPFDRDVTQGKIPSTADSYERKFVVAE